MCADGSSGLGTDCEIASYDRTSPCREQVALHDVGVTWTTIRRPHSAQ